MNATGSDLALRLKHYRLHRSVVKSPALFFEINVEFQDVRSGYRDSVRELLVAPRLEERELDWTTDMVQRVEREWLEEIEPPGRLEWPEFGDEKMIRYLVERYRRRIWKNFALGLYSHPGESQQDFMTRCRELVLQERARELKKFRDVFVRRFLELEQRGVERITEEEWDTELKNRRLVRLQDLFCRVREDLSRWSLREDYLMLDPEGFQWKAEVDPILQDRLDDLRRDLVATYNQITQECEFKANQIEPYEVSLTCPQVEIVSRGVVWSPDTVKIER